MAQSDAGIRRLKFANDAADYIHPPRKPPRPGQPTMRTGAAQIRAGRTRVTHCLHNRAREHGRRRNANDRDRRPACAQPVNLSGAGRGAARELVKLHGRPLELPTRPPQSGWQSLLPMKVPGRGDPLRVSCGFERPSASLGVSRSGKSRPFIRCCIPVRRRRGPIDLPPPGNHRTRQGRTIAWDLRT